MSDITVAIHCIHCISIRHTRQSLALSTTFHPGPAVEWIYEEWTLFLSRHAEPDIAIKDLFILIKLA